MWRVLSFKTIISQNLKDTPLSLFVHPQLSVIPQIKEQLCQLKIIHVFGQVAGLDWQDLDDKIVYRTNINHTNVQRLADKLRIIYEGGENPAIQEAQKLISKAHDVLFLGFGYAKENLEVLGIPEVLKKVAWIRGTALGLTKKEIAHKRVSLKSKDKTWDNIEIYDWDCLQLLRESL
jgi:hypothetical protein